MLNVALTGAGAIALIAATVALLAAAGVVVARTLANFTRYRAHARETLALFQASAGSTPRIECSHCRQLLPADAHYCSACAFPVIDRTA
jgi:hypothetical protein